jgi:hypothetical protein
MMPRRHQTIACAKTGSCALSPFSVAYTTSISGRQRMLTELLRMTAVEIPIECRCGMGSMYWQRGEGWRGRGKPRGRDRP